MSENFFRKSCRLWENILKCGEAREVTDENKIWCMQLAYSISKATGAQVPTHTYTPTHLCMHARARTKICNSSYSFTPTIVSWTRFIITLHVLYLYLFVSYYCTKIKYLFMKFPDTNLLFSCIKPSIVPYPVALRDEERKKTDRRFFRLLHNIRSQREIIAEC